MTTRFVRSLVAAAALAAALAGPARAHGNPSDASALSMLPVAVSVAAPALLLSGGAVLTVVAVEAGLRHQHTNLSLHCAFLLYAPAREIVRPAATRIVARRGFR